MIAAQDLTFSYHGQTPLFDGLTFAVPGGGLLRVAGPSGCGKTTLLHCLCHVIPRHIGGQLSGRIAIDGVPVGDFTQEQLPCAVALVPQQPGSRMFLPAAEDELAFTPENLCVPHEEMHGLVERVLALTGLSGKRHEAPGKLSGGQCKLLALACALAIPPRVLLLDELTAGLDGPAAALALGCVDGLRRQGCAVVVSDHDAGFWDGADTLRLGGV